MFNDSEEMMSYDYFKDRKQPKFNKSKLNMDLPDSSGRMFETLLDPQKKVLHSSKDKIIYPNKINVKRQERRIILKKQHEVKVKIQQDQASGSHPVSPSNSTAFGNYLNTTGYCGYQNPDTVRKSIIINSTDDNELNQKDNFQLPPLNINQVTNFYIEEMPSNFGMSQSFDKRQ